MMTALLSLPVAAGQRVEAVRVGDRDGVTRVVVDLSAAPDYRLFRLADPERLVIDLPDATLSREPDQSLFAGTPVRALRTGRQADGRLRLVLDLASAVTVRDFSLAPDRAAGRGYRLVLDLAAASSGEAIAAEPPTADVTTDVPAATPAGGEISKEIADARKPTAVAVNSEVGAAQPMANAEATPRQALQTRLPESNPSPADSSLMDVSFSGTWQHEWAWATEPNAAQKFESIIQPRWDIGFDNGASVTAILRLRGDTIGDLGPDANPPPSYSDVTRPWLNRAESELSLRELYVDFRWGRSDWRLGKQQVVWGQADGIKVLDVVNPQSFREFILDDFDDSRIPLWTANVTVPLGNTANLQLLWIPDTTYHELAELDTPFAFTTPRIIPDVPIAALRDPERPDNPWTDGDVGFALTGFAGGWDLSFNYLYHYLDTPILPVRLRQTAIGPLPVLEPGYERSHLVGGTASTVLGDVTLRTELAYSSDTFQPTSSLADSAVAGSPELSAVLGLDWAMNMDTLLSVQLFNSTLFDPVDAMGRDEHEQLVTLLYQQDFANAIWRFRGIGIHSINDADTQLQLRLSYWFTGDLQLWLGGDVFSGSRRGLFGQFDAQDRVLVGFEYGF